MKSQLSVREDESKQFQSMFKSLSTQLLTQLSTLEDVQEMIGKTSEMIKIMSEKRHKIKNLKDQLTKPRDSLVKEQSEKLQFEKSFLALLGRYQNENLFLQELVNKLGKLLITSDHQINTKQKTAGQNGPSSSKTVAEVVTDANQENAVPDSTVEECRIVTKNPKLHSRSDNGSDKNYVITSAVISTTEISSQSKRKLMLKLESLS